MILCVQNIILFSKLYKVKAHTNSLKDVPQKAATLSKREEGESETFADGERRRGGRHATTKADANLPPPVPVAVAVPYPLPSIPLTLPFGTRCRSLCPSGVWWSGVPVCVVICVLFVFACVSILSGVWRLREQRKGAVCFTDRRIAGVVAWAKGNT